MPVSSVLGVFAFVTVASTVPLMPPPTQACSGPGPATIRRQVGAMGTVLSLNVSAGNRAEALAASEAGVRAIAAVESRLSTWREDSELAALNRHPPGDNFPLTPELARDLDLAARMWRLTGGAFDPAIGAILHSWDVRGAGRRPSRHELAAARRASGMALFRFTQHGAMRLHPALRLEEGGFGKGVGLDAALAAVREAGASWAMLDFGGQVALLPSSEGCEVVIAHPRRRTEEVARLRLFRGSLATSGNSQRRRGRPHLFDPRTGQPAPDFGSLSVWAPTAAEADALATGLFVLGPHGALAWAERHPDYGVLVLQTRGNTVRLLPSPALATGRLPVRLVANLTRPTQR